MSEPAVDAMGRAQVLVGIAARRVGQPVEYSDPSTDRPYWVWERGRRQVRLYPDPWCHLITLDRGQVEVVGRHGPLLQSELRRALDWMRGCDHE